MVSIEELFFDTDYEISLTRTSYAALQAGDLVSFDYQDGTSRWGLVVKSKRSGTKGYFLSTQDNLLLNIFQLDGITQSMMGLIVNNLYKNRIRCTYKNAPKILSSFIGKDNFRTFNIGKVSKLTSIGIKK
jgi:hypothetical protein